MLNENAPMGLQSLIAIHALRDDLRAGRTGEVTARPAPYLIDDPGALNTPGTTLCSVAHIVVKLRTEMRDLYDQRLGVHEVVSQVV
jgi:hypothetical protein